MWTTCSFNRLKWYFFYTTSCDTKPLAFHQSSLCSSTVGLSLWLENLRSSRSCTSQDFKHLLWIPTRTWTGSLTFLFILFYFFLFIASQWRHLKCGHVCSTDIQKHLCLFFFFFKQNWMCYLSSASFIVFSILPKCYRVSKERWHPGE